MNGVNDSKLRGCLAFSNKFSSRESLIISNVSPKPYYKKMEINNNLPDEKVIDPINSFHLSYAGVTKISVLVSLATDQKSASNS